MGNTTFRKLHSQMASSEVLIPKQCFTPKADKSELEFHAHRLCARCIMDTTDPDIAFDETGVCNHCHRYDRLSRERLFVGSKHEGKLEFVVSEIKASGRGNDYDCIIGVSGGVDSSYVAHLVKHLGLRPLAVHLDNGWDSELAVSNIKKILQRLGIDLYTYVIDWEEFKDLQLAFLKASTPDSEIPTDHAIMAILYRVAALKRVRYIILGTNVVSEAILPLKWGYGYSDLKYIKAIHRKFGTKQLRSFPRFSLLRLFYYMICRRIRVVSLLNYVSYDKKQAIETIQTSLGWINYGGKHHESIYTRFFQAYILPRKFSIDKRKAHYSNLVLSGQMKREEALSRLGEPMAPATTLQQDRQYVIKKLGMSEPDFERIMHLAPKTFLDYPSHYALLEKIKKMRQPLVAIMHKLSRAF
jgi:N-acetyl sugar amidotransferase